MTSRLVIEIPGRPTPWERAAPRRGRKGRRTPQKTDDAERIVKGAALEAVFSQKWEVLGRDRRAKVTLDVYTDTEGGDVDNYEKAVYDGLTKSGVVWVDDKQIRGEGCSVTSVYDRHDGVTAASCRILIVVEDNGPRDRS